MPKIYMYYTITPNQELIISSYHANLQSKSNCAQLAKKAGLSFKDLKSLDGSIPDNPSYGDIKEKLLELLSHFNNLPAGNEYIKVTYIGDLNLCTNKKEPTPCLFDGTLNQFFSGKEVYLILESANSDFVDKAIELADKNQLSGITLQVKGGGKAKIYPHAEMKTTLDTPSANISFMEDSTDSTEKMTDPKSLGRIGIFTPASSVTSSSSPQSPTDKLSRLTRLFR
ncbi:Uncharacterised protein [Legionella wadsworthii]|uniref:Uncharacterized protein n=1 Tax=Legionella wadsworthii TaxID=28088 RepID=A0A378LP44_9GAMM|nr:hypothetical protein [Legionella wadsworthii]STY28524.1 Uncharacterised protein [Legionella wadsworthii]